MSAGTTLPPAQRALGFPDRGLRDDPVSCPAPDLLRREIDGVVATLTLQSPVSRNALSLAMIEALIDAVAAIEVERRRGSSSSPAKDPRCPLAMTSGNCKPTATTSTAGARFSTTR